MAARVPHAPGDGDSAVPDAPIDALERFPDENPNPVLRIDQAGVLLYANPASAVVVRALGVTIGDRLPEDVLGRLRQAAHDRAPTEVVADRRTFAVHAVAVADLGLLHLYLTDVTAERAIVKFPASNPNPVLRIDPAGRLVFANPAAAPLTEGLGLQHGEPLPDDLRDGILGRAAAGDRAPWEVEAAGRWFALVVVDVPEFGFVNVYGTDVTAVRERERLARENERLLLNILPEPIAARLRAGDALIADRFDDVTLLFADIVEFTRLSASMAPDELVGVLNDVFTVFDDLVERHGLEKVKTIGDAYMVVGGLTVPLPDHTARVAAMALDLTDCLSGIGAARRLGIAFRIGMHCGPVVAGVIGTRKFIYDVWGDTVNLASRMESTGIPGRVQVTHAVRERLDGAFTFEPRGLVDVKGKGPTPAWLLTGRRPADARSASGRPATDSQTAPDRLPGGVPPAAGR
jgi:class 3 adenylate cyclase